MYKIYLSFFLGRAGSRLWRRGFLGRAGFGCWRRSFLGRTSSRRSTLENDQLSKVISYYSEVYRRSANTPNIQWKTRNIASGGTG